MQLPKEIVGKNRIRDFKICNAYLNNKPTTEIAKQYNISQNRVYAILHNNSTYLGDMAGWSKAKRLLVLERVANNTGIKLSPGKDILNVVEQMRKEKEGDKPLIEQHNHLTKVEIQVSDDIKTPLAQKTRANI